MFLLLPLHFIFSALSHAIFTMRLLGFKADGTFTFQEFEGKYKPPYAILSHTWDSDSSKEVSFQDIEAGTGQGKPGYRKVEFCAKQAELDGLRYFWIDSCCIDKRNATELFTAINSMFKWYQGATKCYVYLADLPVADDGPSEPNSWETTFMRCRWYKTLPTSSFTVLCYTQHRTSANSHVMGYRFERSWTLQELLAPSSVDFFDSDGRSLGTKSSLETLIQQRTKIPKKVLQGSLLSNLEVNERFSWGEHRDSKIEEDQIYSLLGIFDISMPLLYGEGKQKAYERLRKEIDIAHKGRL